MVLTFRIDETDKSAKRNENQEIQYFYRADVEMAEPPCLDVLRWMLQIQV